MEICDDRRDDVLPVRPPQQARYYRNECCQASKEICDGAFQNAAAGGGCNSSVDFIPQIPRQLHSGAVFGAGAKTRQATAEERRGCVKIAIFQCAAEGKAASNALAGLGKDQSGLAELEDG
jgi:hypothetical protein